MVYNDIYITMINIIFIKYSSRVIMNYFDSNPQVGKNYILKWKAVLERRLHEQNLLTFMFLLVHVIQKSHMRYCHHFMSITVVNSEGVVGKLLTFQYVSQNLAQ